MSTDASIVAAASSGLWRRLLDPPPRIVCDGPLKPMRGEATYLAARADLATILPLIVPGTLTQITVGGASTTRYVALQHAEWSNLYAVSYDLGYRYGKTRTYGSNTSGLESLVKVTVHYETLAYPINGNDAYLIVRGEGYTKNYPVEATFAGGGTPAYDAYKPVSGTLLSVTVNDSPNITAAQEAAWTLAQNSVNLGTFRNNAPGLVLYQKPTFEYVNKFDGTQTCNYTLTFDACQVPHNQEYTRSGTLDTLWVNGAARYPSLDFGTLFK